MTLVVDAERVMQPTPAEETLDERNPRDYEDYPVDRIARILWRKRTDPPKREQETKDSVQLSKILFDHTQDA